MRAFRALVVSVTAIGSSTAAHAQAADEPYKWVRSLEAVQEQIVRGSDAAHASQQRLITLIAKEIEAADAETLLEPRNLRAVLSYAMGGGDERVLRHLLRIGNLPELEERIAKGALAYAEGRHSDAMANLAGINARELSSALAGRVALIQGILYYRADVKRAIALLDDARLLGTGTLVEEAALRRGAVMTAAIGQFEKFEMLSEQYFRRFGRSVYSKFFMQQFSQAAAVEEFGPGSDRVKRLREMIEHLDEADRRLLYLLLAESGVYRGNLSLTSFAAGEGVKLSPDGSPERRRCELYSAAVLIAGNDSDEAIRSLKSIQAAGFSKSDAQLLTAALEVGDDIVRPLDDLFTGKPQPIGKSLEAEKASESDNAETTGTVELAKAVIGRADQILAGARRP